MIDPNNMFFFPLILSVCTSLMDFVVFGVSLI